MTQETLTAIILKEVSNELKRQGVYGKLRKHHFWHMFSLKRALGEDLPKEHLSMLNPFYIDSNRHTFNLYVIKSFISQIPLTGTPGERETWTNISEKCLERINNVVDELIKEF